MIFWNYVQGTIPGSTKRFVRSHVQYRNICERRNSSIDINISAETSVYHSQANKHDLCGIICNSEKHDYNSRHASQLVPCDHFCHYFFSILWKMTSRKRVPRFDTDFLPASSDWKSNIWISINWWMSCNPELRLPCFQTHTASITLMSHLTSKYKVVCGREYQLLSL